MKELFSTFLLLLVFFTKGRCQTVMYPCPALQCSRQCIFYAYGTNGCMTCTCVNQRPQCPACDCPNGGTPVPQDIVDQNGCRTCVCIPGPTPTNTRPALCNLPPTSGMCLAAIQRYAYNMVSDRCELFTFGGCGGNQNNFNTLKDCQIICNATVSDAPKPGTCPQATGIGLCVEACSDDGNCPMEQKCCSNGCGRTCQAPVQAPQPPAPPAPPAPPQGTCPPPGLTPEMCLFVRFAPCRADNECLDGQKCCYNGCGNTCMAPESPTENCTNIKCASGEVCKMTSSGPTCTPPSTPGTCPPPGLTPDMCLFVRFTLCRSDTECSNGQKCCYNGCGNTCMAPESPTESCTNIKCASSEVCKMTSSGPTCTREECPRLPGDLIRPAVCRNGCNNHSDCSGQQICCSLDACSTQCMTPVQPCPMYRCMECPLTRPYRAYDENGCQTCACVSAPAMCPQCICPVGFRPKQRNAAGFIGCPRCECEINQPDPPLTDPCKTVRCGPLEKCETQVVQCITAPCPPPTAICVTTNTPSPPGPVRVTDSCSSLSCNPDEECRMQEPSICPPGRHPFECQYSPFERCFSKSILCPEFSCTNQCPNGFLVAATGCVAPSCTCAPPKRPTCNTHRCGLGEHCEMQYTEMCVADGPCLRSPVCVPDAASTLNCEMGRNPGVVDNTPVLYYQPKDGCPSGSKVVRMDADFTELCCRTHAVFSDKPACENGSPQFSTPRHQCGINAASTQDWMNSFFSWFYNRSKSCRRGMVCTQHIFGQWSICCQGSHTALFPFNSVQQN